MKMYFKAAALGATLAFSTLAAHAATSSDISGDYIESRSASVYAGPCHYSNEAVTAGRNAILAWRFETGSWNGAALDGLNVVAVLDAPHNLGENNQSRRSVLYLDERATPAQATALRAFFTTKYAAELGEVEAVKSVPVQVNNDGLDYTVKVPGVVELDVNRYPCQHCTQDAQIWYQPFVPAREVIVGKTTRSRYADNTLGVTWNERQEANSAFVGSFAF